MLVTELVQPRRCHLHKAFRHALRAKQSQGFVKFGDAMDLPAPEYRIQLARQFVLVRVEVGEPELAPVVTAEQALADRRSSQHRSMPKGRGADAAHQAGKHMVALGQIVVRQTIHDHQHYDVRRSLVHSLKQYLPDIALSMQNLTRFAKALEEHIGEAYRIRPFAERG
jgi:hypothetical protein